MSMKPRGAARRMALVDDVSGATPARTGRLVGFDEDGRVLVQLHGSREKLPARRLLRLDQAFRRAVLERRSVMLLFEDGDARKPVIAGVIDPDGDGPSAADAARRVSHPTRQPLILETDEDGRRVKLTAKDEIVLVCGSASITLRRNGRVIVRGTEVDSRAEGAQRIRGGQIRLN